MNAGVDAPSEYTKFLSELAGVIVYYGTSRTTAGSLTRYVRSLIAVDIIRVSPFALSLIIVSNRTAMLII